MAERGFLGLNRLENRVGPGLHHVVAADADGVELGHVLRTVGDDVGNDPHGRLRRVDIGVAGQVFFEDVVLNRPGQLLLLDALLFCSHDITGHDRQDRAVHGHGNAHLVEWDLIEQDFHVLHRVDRHTGLADIADHPGMVRVVAAVGRQVEGHRKSFLSGRQISAIKRV
jgi:hypothetical protein